MNFHWNEFVDTILVHSKYYFLSENYFAMSFTDFLKKFYLMKIDFYFVH